MKSGVSGSRFQRGFGCDGHCGRGSFIGARTSRRWRSGVDRPIHQPHIASGDRIRAWIYASDGRNALIVESGHRRGGTRGPDISIDDCVGSLVSHPGAAAKAAKRRDGWSEDHRRCAYCCSGCKHPGIRCAAGGSQRIACSVRCSDYRCGVGFVGDKRCAGREGGNKVDRIIGHGSCYGSRAGSGQRKG